MHWLCALIMALILVVPAGPSPAAHQAVDDQIRERSEVQQWDSLCRSLAFLAGEASMYRNKRVPQRRAIRFFTRGLKDRQATELITSVVVDVYQRRLDREETIADVHEVCMESRSPKTVMVVQKDQPLDQQRL